MIILVYCITTTYISIVCVHCVFPSGRVQPLLGRFSELLQLEVKPGSVDAVLLDAGCSSMQMDQAQRGFSLSRDGPLDMRMDGDRQVLPMQVKQMKKQKNDFFKSKSKNLQGFGRLIKVLVLAVLQLLRTGCLWPYCLNPYQCYQLIVTDVAKQDKTEIYFNINTPH